MRRILFTVPVATLFMAIILLLGPGCSLDSSLSPADVGTAKLANAVAIDSEPTFVETFEDHSNVGNWSFFGLGRKGIEVIEDEGGNPGAFLHAGLGVGHNGYLNTIAPQLHTRVSGKCIFTGDYRAAGVVQVGVDVAIFGPPENNLPPLPSDDRVITEGRPLSLLLRNDAGTPEDYSDDLTAYYIGDANIPMPDSNFVEYAFAIPSQSTTLPEGWYLWGDVAVGEEDAVWNEVITGVSEVTFFFGNPELFAIFQAWDVGVDNVSIWLDE